MRRLFAVLILFFCSALPTVAHADSFEYTLVWDFPHVANADTSAFLGTYTFTVDSLLSGTTYVYGPGFSDPQYPGFPYVYASDFTVPTNSTVSQIEIQYFPDYTPYNTIGIKSLYGFSLDQANGAAGVSTSLIQDANDPTKFFADYGDGSGSFASMEITQLSTSPVPEPSTITLFGFGALAFGARIYRRVIHT
jgi:hypothetical protein